jgi:hypothetical protein
MHRPAYSAVCKTWGGASGPVIAERGSSLFESGVCREISPVHGLPPGLLLALPDKGPASLRRRAGTTGSGHVTLRPGPDQLLWPLSSSRTPTGTGASWGTGNGPRPCPHRGTPALGRMGQFRFRQPKTLNRPRLRVGKESTPRLRGIADNGSGAVGRVADNDVPINRRDFHTCAIPDAPDRLAPSRTRNVDIHR